MRTKLVVALIIVAALLAFRHSATAQNGFAKSGVAEIGGTIGFSSTSNPDSEADALTTFNFSPFVGIFVTDGFQIGLNPLSITVIDLGGNSITDLLVLFSAGYNFSTDGPVYPFLEGLVGYNSTGNGETASGAVFGGRGGLKVAIAEHALLVIGLQFRQRNLGTSGQEDLTLNIISLDAGFSVWVP